MASIVNLDASIPVPSCLIHDANRCWFTRGRAKKKDHRVAIVIDQQVVGFVTPHETPKGWRLGPIYLDPSARGQNILCQVYQMFSDKLMVAFVADDNPASRIAHERAGFSLWKRGNGGCFMRRFPLV